MAGRDRTRARARLRSELGCVGVSAVRARLALAISLRFPGPPYDPGRSDFPSPVLTLACPPTAFPWMRRLKRWHVSTPLKLGLHVGLGPYSMARLPRLSVRDRPRPARCPEVLCLVKVLPLPGWRPAPPQQALPYLHRSYDLMRQTKTLPLPTVATLVSGSLQVAARPCWVMALPDVISADLSPDAWTPTPAAPMVHLLVSSHGTSAFPTLGPGRRSAMSHTATSVWTRISGLQSFTYVQASGFARPTGRSYRRFLSEPRQPGLLLPGVLRLVASPQSGYASRPIRAIDGVGTSTPLDPQPCRLLPYRPR